ncbi:SusC/RagA family TonB-linked outer membrane protein [Hymenobacter psychrophilus]|uniref:Iron complex outermembrane recepter protein n=1 Tax=Hymenobacter psychrophilus TaxID=651662 RepID=A0A1H3BJY3_9BACT|nr:TonB-dependent receptor [Hymenobacter psychrophilus]SDX41644.1 iron complex outermembrane recepter protein [Hymenobacter psychrophilus]
MKNPYLAKMVLPLLCAGAGISSVHAQGIGTVSGRVVDEKGEGLPGVTVLIEGSSVGGSTNGDGTYLIQNAPTGSQTLVISFIGYSTQRQTISVVAGQNTTVRALTLSENTTLLNEAVVVGYGVQRRQDLTGAVSQISEKEFVKGQVTNPEQLIQGKVAGLQVTTSGGAPGAGSTIRIRGGSSLTASNDPLIVIDGVPVDNRGLSGAANPLSLINPNDIESISVLKDASSTAIYGSRASNGVIIVTTKKGVQGQELRVNVSSQNSVSQAKKYVDVLSGDEFRKVVLAQGNAQQIALLGQDQTVNTDWQREIYRTALTTDNNVSLTGAVGAVPFRVSGGYLDQEGLLLKNDLKRYTGSVGLSPVLLDGNLRVNVNVKGSWVDNNFSNQGAVGAAVFANPTLPIYAPGNPYGGFNEVLKDGNLNTLATRNPLGLINQRRDRSTVKRSIGNIQLDYALPFLTGLRANLNLGYDVQQGRGSVLVPSTAASDFNRVAIAGVAAGQGGLNNFSGQDKNNRLLEFYLNYNKEVGPGRLDLLAGHSYQRFADKNYVFADRLANEAVYAAAPTLFSGLDYRDPKYVLLSFYGRANYNLSDKYLLTATMRADGSSRFREGQQWGYFPSAAAAWRLKGEDFLLNSTAVSELKLRLGYGQTGQQDIGDIYPYLARYTFSESTSQYQFGDEFSNTLRAAPYDRNIKWETSTTYNAGIDYGFLDNRFNGTFDVYYRKTDDLLNNVFVPALSNLSNKLTTNVGSLESRGLEAALNVDVVRGTQFNWTVNANANLYKLEITKLTNATDPSYLGDNVGGIEGGNNGTIQINSVGYQPNAFYVYQQVYGADGKPLEGVYVDRNGNGTIDSDDRYQYQSPAPKAILGFGSNFSYGKASLAFTMRANLGNYVYNNVRAQAAFPQAGSDGVLNNLNREFLTSGFVTNTTERLQSDYYVENASFMRLENLTAGYDFGNIYKDKANLRVSLAVQNLFVTTNYKGLDPEITTGTGKTALGIDNTIYPRPRTITLGLNLGF